MESDYEISLIDLFKGLKNDLLLIILTGIIIGAATFAFNKFVVKPEYETSASIMVGVDKDDENKNDENNEINDVLKYNDLREYDKLQVNKSLMSTYSEVIKSKDVANKVIEALSLDMDYDEFSDKVSISQVKDTQVINIDVVDSDPKIATDIANETADIFKKSIANLFDLDNIKIVDKAYAPKSPSSPNVIKNSLSGIVIGLFIGIIISIIKQLMDNSFKNENEFYRVFDIPVLGMIPNKEKGE
ncbi:MAG: Wzz/FepE/Etk N-terminal domain-containing protein [Tissierellia bacterium]|nr:Wzz/FepE/Etk N-terminal domain-containing protein [Tissierellia bacterium]